MMPIHVISSPDAHQSSLAARRRLPRRSLAKAGRSIANRWCELRLGMPVQLNAEVQLCLHLAKHLDPTQFTLDAPMFFVRDCSATIEVKCRTPQNGNRGKSKPMLRFPIETKREDLKII
jgi:hypothetical protein